MRLSAFARRNTTYQISSIGNSLFTMKRALLAGVALANNAGIFVD
jgi:hypothetical protein